MRYFTVAAAAVALLMPGTAVAAAPATTTRSYAASGADFANPGRGFFTYTETHLAAGAAAAPNAVGAGAGPNAAAAAAAPNAAGAGAGPIAAAAAPNAAGAGAGPNAAGGAGYTPLDAGALAEARTNQGRSLVFRIFYLERYRAVDTFTKADLALIAADFATARKAGVKLVVRFAYTADSDADPPVDRVLRHIAQLRPLLTGNADVLTAVQAGFVGRWGEWYYTQHFASWADRGKVVRALLAATAPTTAVQVRTPEIKRRLAPAVARVGLHNDCFLAGTDDYGTFPAAGDRAWLAAQTFLVGGETCDPSARSGWANASKELAAYHWTYLNPSFHAGVLASWGAAGRAEASRRLGYRLRLVSAELPTRAGTPVTLTLVNDGYAAPATARPVRLVITRGTTRRTVTVPADIRTWQPGKKITLTVRLAVPPGSGPLTLALSLPDPAARLAANPAYAIRLANTGTWDATRGWNTLATWPAPRR